MLMPLMYVPMVWACGVCAVQSIGEILLLVSLAFLAFSPAVYTVFGICRAVTSPMSRKGVLDFCQAVEKWTTICHLVALFCFSVYLVKIYMTIHEIEERKEGLAAFALEQVRKLLLPLLLGEVTNLVSLLFSGVVWSMLFTFSAAMFLTTIVGADWMMRSSAEEWHAQGEEYYVEMQEEHKFEDAYAEKLHRDLVAAMSAMLEVTHRRGTLASDATATAETPDSPPSWSAVPNGEPPSPPQFTLQWGPPARSHRGQTARSHRGGRSIGH